MRPRGATLIECLVALVVGGVLMAAVYGLLQAGARLSRVAASARDVRHGVQAVAQVLRAELHAVSPPSGDLLAMSDSAVVIRAQRGFGVACGAPAGADLVLDDSLLALLRAVDPAKDSALVFAAGDPRSVADDRWVGAAVTAVRRGRCAGGAGGTVLTLAAPPADLALVRSGAPVRLFEVLEYRRYRDATGQWWLGVRGPAAGGGWAATSPVAGPLQAARGLELVYLDAAQSVTTVPAAVALVRITVRGTAERAAAPGVVPRDSLTLLVATGR